MPHAMVSTPCNGIQNGSYGGGRGGLLPIRGSLNYVCSARSQKHGGATRRRTYVDTEVILSSHFGVPRVVASDYKWLVATTVYVDGATDAMQPICRACVEITTCRKAICGFPMGEACGNLQVTCDMYHTYVFLAVCVCGCVGCWWVCGGWGCLILYCVCYLMVPRTGDVQTIHVADRWTECSG